MKGSISIHNHPIARGEIMGDSFSKQDLGFAAEYKLGIQYLISGERKDMFIYTGNLGYYEMLDEYNKALNEVRETAWNTNTEITYECEQVMKILSKKSKGVVFYGNI